MPAVLTVDPRSGVPIYLQIVEQVKRSVALGVLQVRRAAADGQTAGDRPDGQPEHRCPRIPRTRAGSGHRDGDRSWIVRPHGRSRSLAESRRRDRTGRTRAGPARGQSRSDSTATRSQAIFEAALERWFSEPRKAIVNEQYQDFELAEDLRLDARGRRSFARGSKAPACSGYSVPTAPAKRRLSSVCSGSRALRPARFSTTENR